MSKCNGPRVKHAPGESEEDRDHLSSFWHLSHASTRTSQAPANRDARARNRKIDTAGQTKALTCHPDLLRIQETSRDRDGARHLGTTKTPPS